MQRMYKIGTIIVLLLAILCASVWGYLFYYFSGGLTNILLDHTPPPTQEQITPARHQAITTLRSTQKDIQTHMPMMTYGDTTDTDLCYKGQHNYKVHDAYAYRCAYRITYFYGFSEDFPHTLTALDTYLRMHHWQANEDASLGDVVEQYQEHAATATTENMQHNPARYAVSGLLKARYAKGGVSVTINYAERKTPDHASLESEPEIEGGTLDILYDKKKALDIPKVFINLTTTHTYILTISLQQTYFHN